MKSVKTEMPSAAVAALGRGKKIEAIKIVREHSKLGLAEAKSVVEAYAAQHPEIEGRMKERASDATWGLKSVLSALFVIGLAYYYFSK